MGAKRRPTFQLGGDFSQITFQVRVDQHGQIDVVALIPLEVMLGIDLSQAEDGVEGVVQELAEDGGRMEDVPLELDHSVSGIRRMPFPSVRSNRLGQRHRDIDFP